MSDAEAMLEDCQKRESKLNEWERGFIQSISEIDIENISPKQYETLENIWEKVT